MKKFLKSAYNKTKDHIGVGAGIAIGMAVGGVVVAAATVVGGQYIKPVVSPWLAKVGINWS